MPTQTKSSDPVQLTLFTAADLAYIDPEIPFKQEVENLLRVNKGYERFGAYSIENINKLIPKKGTKPLHLPGTVVLNNTSDRLRALKSQHTCCMCGVAGSVYIAERHSNEADDRPLHLNLYAMRNGGATLMTVDHILVDSLGGKYDTTNFQTMCRICNSNKAAMMSNKDIAAIRTNPAAFAKSWVHIPTLHAFLDLLEVYNNTDSKQAKKEIVKIYDESRKLFKHDKPVEEMEQLRVVIYAKLVKVARTFGVKVPYTLKKLWLTDMRDTLATFASKASVHWNRGNYRAAFYTFVGVAKPLIQTVKRHHRGRKLCV